MKQKRMRKLAAAIALLCMCSTALAPVAASAATITIKDANNVSVAGRTFNAYKIMSVETGTAAGSTTGQLTYNYTVEDAWKPVLIAYFGLDVDTATNEDIIDAFETLGSDNSAAMQSFANYLKNSKPNVEADGTAENVTGDTATITVDPGYYLVLDTGAVDTAVSAVMLQTATDTVEVSIKTGVPTIEKKIWEDDDNDSTVDDGELVDANTASIGDVVEYYVTSKIPSTTFYADYFFKMTDTFDKGLTYNENSLVITANGTELQKGTDYTVTVTPNATTGETTVVINFLNMKALGDVADNVGKDIIVTYDATVDTDAVVGTEGNENAILLEYSNDPSKSDKDTDKDGIPDSKEEEPKDTDDDGTPDFEDDDDDGDTIPDSEDDDDDGDGIPDNEDTDDSDDDNDGIPDNEETNTTEETPEDVVITYLSEFTIVKTDQNDNTLEGVGFTLYSDAACTTGNEVYLKPVYDTTDTTKVLYYILAESTDTGAVKEVSTPADGTIRIYGLAAGTYYFKETTGKAGYNQIDDVITMTLTAARNENGTDYTVHNAAIVHDVDETCAWTHTYKIGAEAEKSGNTVTVINKSGSILPSTGGMGTALFTVSGITLMIGAAGLYVVKRRVSNK